MKKLKRLLIVGAAVIMMAVSFHGCGSCDTATAEDVDDRFMDVYSQFDGVYGDVHIIVDRETGVMYLLNDIANGGGVTVMVDENGKPMIWEEQK